jgi:hypothetical protein
MGWRPLTLGLERTLLSDAWVTAAWGRTTYRSSACPEINVADWPSWEGDNPGDGSLLLPEGGNPQHTL